MAPRATGSTSGNGGSGWTTLGSASTTAAVTLKATDLLRFVPAANYNGAATALSANLIDSGQSITSGAILNLTGATGGTSHISTAAVALAETITAVNDAPVLSAHSATIAYIENAAAKALLAGVSVSDADAPAGFAGGAVTVALAGAIAGDELRLVGVTVTLSGSNILVGGTAIGAISAGGLSGGQTSATISLNGNATTAAVNAVLQALAFGSTSENPTSAVRTATVTFSDGGNTGSGGAQSDAATVTINVTPVNDPAVLSAAVVQLTEADTAAAISTSGQLTISDVDSPATFVAQSSVLGQSGIFSINASGSWTYVASSAHDEFVAGQTYTDTFAVTSADSTATSVTINIAGTDDAAIITGGDAGAVTEAGGIANGTPGLPSVSGTLSATDVDGLALFVMKSDAPTAYGRLSITADGAWTYTLDDANATVQALNDGGTLQDVITVATEDGTTHAINITITGSNDAPVIAEASTLIGDVEEDAAPSVSGQIVGVDVDNAAILTYGGDRDGLYRIAGGRSELRIMDLHTQ